MNPKLKTNHIAILLNLAHFMVEELGAAKYTNGDEAFALRDGLRQDIKAAHEHLNKLRGLLSDERERA